MPAFQFRTVPHLIVAPGAATQLGAHVAHHFPTVRRALLVTDAGFLGTGLADDPLHSLRTAGIEVHVFSDVQADPSEAVVLAGVSRAQMFHVELIIGLGGGSSLDVAKLVAVLAAGHQDLAQLYGIGNVHSQRLPLVQLPTTAGTGSEVTQIAIVTTGASSKMGIVAPQLYADLAILDAKLTLSLPPAVTAATGIDAMVHAIEAYTSRLLKNPLSDMLAIEALSLLSGNLLTACRDGSNLPAREAMLLGAMLAGQAFANAPVAAVHALAYPIGSLFHVPHGLSNALVLPHVLRFNLSHAAPLYAQLASVVQPGITGSEKARAEALIDAMQDISAATGIARTLREVGVMTSDLDRLADDAMLQTRLLGNNARVVTRKDARAIYAAAL
ncbi:iron-containing alcohol dehydrogenase [Janthinobacterium lividum]|uniref:Alcohol dehydrogenase n=1 Tax=Janthinobacterium lividum TaxID=29581 RepID=A0A1E8PRH4_9BURK|nr:alcohol dehydrogenase [Janthinobacterium lividum]